MTVRVFEINDCEWWAGDGTPEEILAAYMKTTGLSREDSVGDNESLPTELSEEDMQRLTFHVDEDRRGPTITFREQLDKLIAEGAQLPCFFATTEF